MPIRFPDVAVVRSMLPFEAELDGVQGFRELDQKVVAHRLAHPTVVHVQQRSDEALLFLEETERSGLAPLGQRVNPDGSANTMTARRRAGQPVPGGPVELGVGKCRRYAGAAPCLRRTAVSFAGLGPNAPPAARRMREQIEVRG